MKTVVDTLPIKAKNSRLVFIFALLTALLVLNSWLLHRCFQVVSEQEHMIQHTFQVLQELDAVASNAKDIETGARGFALAKTEEYLEPFHRGTGQIWSHAATLRTLIDDNPAQQAYYVALELMLKRRFAVLDELVTLVRAGRLTNEALHIRLSEGKASMDSMREQVMAMKTIERELMEKRSSQADRSRLMFQWLLIGTTLITLIAILASFGRIAQAQRAAREQALLKAAEARESDNIAELSKVIAGDISLEQAAERLLAHFVKSLGALAGRVFVDDHGKILPVASVGVHASLNDDDQRRLASNNLVQAALAREDAWLVDQVPADYWQVSSSLGHSIPTCLVFIPYTFQGRRIGVLELAFFARPDEATWHLLQQLGNTIGTGLNAAQARSRMQILLERTQQQAEELQAQQEELRTNNEELEQQARALEAQQQALNIKNQELESTRGELEERAAELERSSQYKSDFLAKMSHELRTPLNGLLILSTLLMENKEGTLTEQQRNFARSINTAGNDLLVLINDILDLSKIEARKLSLRRDHFTLTSLLKSKRMTFGPQADAKGLELVIEGPDNAETFALDTDRTRVEQVLRNFLSNAIKFTGTGRITLTARLSADQTRVSFSVADTGIGIPLAKQASVFDAFEQADSSVSRKYGGTGLGLTISRELAHLLGGEIRLVSQEGVGSTFTLEIPVALAEASESGEPVPTSRALLTEAAPGANPSLRLVGDNSLLQKHEKDVAQALKDLAAERKSILVVEDDDSFRLSVVDAVKSYGFNAIEAADGEIALAILHAHTPDAILLDIKLPGISGLGILEMIKQMPHLRHIPVHMISALEYQNSALRMGALGYLTKPVTLDKVRSAISRIENLLSKQLKRVLLVEDDAAQSEAIAHLISGQDIDVQVARTGQIAIKRLGGETFDCIILDLSLPDISGFDLVKRLSEMNLSLPPIVIYTGKDLTDTEEAYLRRFAESIIIKGARSPERLLDEVNLFLHRVEALLPAEKREILTSLRAQDQNFGHKTVLVVDDDIRNVFALTSALETRGLNVRVARDGVEALNAVQEHTDIDLVIMDIMMPRMDGFEAMRRIRALNGERYRRLPIVALTAKAMRGDHEKCMEAGASDYLRKPVNLDNLSTVLKVWLGPKGFLS